VAAPAPVLVGVDGTAAGARALEWATVRALAGHTSLHIVHVVRGHPWLDPYGLLVSWDFEPLDEAQQVLDEAARSARCQAPQLQISITLREGEAAAALLHEGRAVELIVLGQRRWRGGPGWWLHPSLTTRVARHARGRVVLVGPDNEILV
jgi:nucleotide-binding universal stress UspA family protein